MTGQSILVVDDDEDVREIIQLLLASSGYEVDTAADGFAAIEKLRAGKLPNLILLDLRMPGMDGEQFMTIIRRALADQHVPVVLISGDGEAWRMAQTLGAEGFLQKPVELVDLLETIAKQASPAGTGGSLQFGPAEEALLSSN